MKNLVISTGAGMSAESGLATFRDSGGLWDKYPVMEVASADGFKKNPALVHEFYNIRRKELLAVEPNSAHVLLAELEKEYNVNIITQNVDNLHERAGSSKVLHLHGELMKVRSIKNPHNIYELSGECIETSVDTVDANGDHLRPHIVFFQESVPNFELAIDIVSKADIFVIIGTSLKVYPAANLLSYVPRGASVFYIDPHPAQPMTMHKVTIIGKTATEGVPELIKMIQLG